MNNNFLFKMKNIFLLLLLIPFIGISQAKNVISTNRVFPKVDKVLEFEKALGSHAQKYHTGDVKWRTFFIQSGPDAGGYHIVEGPKSWESEDKRGDINEAHNNDWHKSVTIFLTDRGSSGSSISCTGIGGTPQVVDENDIDEDEEVNDNSGDVKALAACLAKIKK